MKGGNKCSDFKEPKLTCYTLPQLQFIAEKWNEKEKKEKISDIKSKSQEELWKELKEKFKESDERKWSDITRSQNFKNQFAPDLPREWYSEPNAWLSDADINEVMRRFEVEFEGFHFLEASPIDFDKKDKKGNCLVSNLCGYNYEDLASKYKTFGMVFNTDPSTKDGQHWISLFIELQKGNIYFFDSTGNEPPGEVIYLMNKLGTQGNTYISTINNAKTKTKIYVNKFSHQLKDTECGIYSLFFIFFMLTDGDIKKLNSKRIPDEEIQKLRGFFFNDEKKIYENKN
tara:strand:+ start:17932 stop:18789 length:858 start_codon:yes stop_codon:yes gene_type:complete